MNNNVKKKMYIKLYYSLEDWEWYKNANTMRVFLHLLLSANRKDRPYEGDTIKRGEVLASYDFLMSALDLTLQQVRTAIEHLKSTGEITVRKIGKTSVIRITKYNFYQASTENSSIYQQRINNKSTSSKQNNNIETTTLIECNNVDSDIMKECVNGSHTHGLFNNVILTEEEYRKFVADFPRIAENVIDELSAKIMTGDSRYMSGHIGHLYIFARNYKDKNGIKPFDPSCDGVDGKSLNAKILEISRNLDPYAPKRKG